MLIDQVTPPIVVDRHLACLTVIDVIRLVIFGLISAFHFLFILLLQKMCFFKSFKRDLLYIYRILPGILQHFWVSPYLLKRITHILYLRLYKFLYILYGGRYSLSPNCVHADYPLGFLCYSECICIDCSRRDCNIAKRIRP